MSLHLHRPWSSSYLFDSVNKVHDSKSAKGLIIVCAWPIQREDKIIEITIERHIGGFLLEIF
jgi:hypothetical protein